MTIEPEDMKATPKPLSGNRQIVKPFQFELIGPDFETGLVMSVDVDYLNCTLDIRTMEMTNGENTYNPFKSKNWNGSSSIKLRTYDSKGKLLYQDIFYQIELIKNQQEFSYASDSYAVRYISYKYGSGKREVENY